MTPRSIAIVGCSETNVGGTALSNLIANGFEGPLYPVHPTKSTVFGLPAYPDLASVPGAVDCCIVAVRNDLVEPTLDQMHAEGIHAAVIYASGWGELGSEGKAAEEALSRKLKEYDIAACGPNCLGVIDFSSGAVMYSAGIDVVDKRGPIGFISHSGSSCIALTNSNRGTGFSHVVSCGNEAGLTVSDFIRFLVLDDETEVIALHLEGVRNATELAEVAELALRHRKPIVVMNLGRTDVGQQTTAAHSGALASPRAVTEAYFARHGMILVDSLDELLETCELLAGLRHRLPDTEGVVVTAVSGGMAALSADIGSEEGLHLPALSDSTRSQLAQVLPTYTTPRNPLDVTTALHDTVAYTRCLEILAADPDVGLIVVCQGAEPGLNQQQRKLYAPIARMIADVSTRVSTPIASFSPVSGGLELTFNATLRAAGVPHLMGASASLRAVRHLMEWRRFLAARPVVEVIASDRREVDLGTDDVLSESHGKRLLSAYDIPVPQEVLTKDATEARAAATQMGFPVVLKVDTPDIAHKTEAGIVALGLADAEAVERTFSLLIANARNYDVDAKINGISVQQQIPPGVEMLLGIKNDPVFGPAILVGLGGIYTEVFNDASLRLAPVGIAEARSMVSELDSEPLLDGVRGKPRADKDALVDAICALSQLAVHYASEIAELDINPLVVLEEGNGVVALDALVVKR